MMAKNKTTLLFVLIFVLIAGFGAMIISRAAGGLSSIYMVFYQMCLNLWQSVKVSLYMWRDFLIVGFAGLFLIGFIRGAAFLLKHIFFYNKFAKNVSHIGKYTRISGCDLWIIDDDRKFAFTAGLLNPQIYISSGFINILDDNELKSVITHEIYHRDNMHPLLSVLGKFISKVLFFIPLVSKYTEYLLIKYELDADRYTMQNIGSSPLSSSLMKLIDSKESVGYGFGINSFSSIIHRVEFILYNKRNYFRVSLKVLLFSIVVLFLIILNLKPVNAEKDIKYYQYLNNNDFICHDNQDNFIENYIQNKDNLLYVP